MPAVSMLCYGRVGTEETMQFYHSRTNSISYIVIRCLPVAFVIYGQLLLYPDDFAKVFHLQEGV